VDPVTVGFREQTAVVATGMESLMDRAVLEGVSLALEGVHVAPGYPEPSQSGDVSVAQVIIPLDDEDAHRSHFCVREFQMEGKRPLERCRASFTNMCLLGRSIEDLAAERGIPVVNSVQADRAVAGVLELTVDAVLRDKGTKAGADRPTEREESV